MKKLASALAVLHLLACAAASTAQPLDPAFALTGERVRTPAARSAPDAAEATEEEPLPRWDTFAFFGWRGSRIDNEDYSSNRWDARFVYGGAAGYYLTPNIKVEADLSSTSPSRFYEFQEVPWPGAAYPFFARSDHRVVTVSLGGTLIYQFFENASFHPFLGIGAGVITSRDRISRERQSQVLYRGQGIPPEVVVIAEAERPSSHTDHHGRGVLVAGFKTYPGERVFFRSDVQWALGAGRDREISWRLGFGVDF